MKLKNLLTAGMMVALLATSAMAELEAFNIYNGKIKMGYKKDGVVVIPPN